MKKQTVNCSDGTKLVLEFIQHKQEELILHTGEKVFVDSKLKSIIFTLNKKGYKTLYSCQGDRYNAGYIKFDNTINISDAKNVLDVLMPYSILILDDDNIIRIFNTKASWMNYLDFKRHIKKNLRYCIKHNLKY